MEGAKQHATHKVAVLLKHVLVEIQLQRIVPPGIRIVMGGRKLFPTIIKLGLFSEVRASN